MNVIVKLAVGKKLIKILDKCAKCKRIVRNGIMCDICDSWWHLKCAELISFEETYENMYWSRVECTQVGGLRPTSPHEDHTECEYCSNSSKGAIEMLNSEIKNLTF